MVDRITRVVDKSNKTWLITCFRSRVDEVTEISIVDPNYRMRDSYGWDKGPFSDKWSVYKGYYLNETKAQKIVNLCIGIVENCY